MKEQSWFDRFKDYICARISKLLPKRIWRHCLVEAAMRQHDKTKQGILDMTFDDIWDGTL